MRDGLTNLAWVSQTQRFYAEVELDRAAIGFIRSNSAVIIKKSYGIADAVYLDITRGSGHALERDAVDFHST